MKKFTNKLLQAINDLWNHCEHQDLVLVSRQTCYTSDLFPVNFKLKAKYTYKCVKCGERKVFFKPYETSL